jgi:hypothetical protein
MKIFKPPSQLLSGAIFALSLLMLPAANAVEVANVKVPDTANVANTPLVLNGAGIRVKAIFKVYVAALYLAEKKSTPAEVLSLGGPKRMTLVALRDISADQFGQNFMDGISKNSSKTERTNIINQLEKFGTMFADLAELKKGDVITMDWTPGVGTVASLNGKKIAEPFPDEAFYNAFLRIWLGPQPAYAPLKSQLLGMAEKAAAPAREQ